MVVKPAANDTSQASVLAENRRERRRGVEGQPAKSNPALLAMWASPYAVSAGDTLDVHVHSVAAMLLLQVYRLGWYGGVGGRLVDSLVGIPGGVQPRCTDRWSGIVACPWRVSTRLVIPSDWVGGVYLLKVRDGRGDIWSYPFVLRSREAHRFTAVINQFTWQAYNKWGGASFYSFLPTSTRYTYPTISFDRPYLDEGGMTVTGGPDEAGGSNDLPAIRWLEASGYDVGYASDVDLADGAADLPSQHALLFVGHDEYWTWNEVDRVQALRDGGTHLAFLSGRQRRLEHPDDGRDGRPVAGERRSPATSISPTPIRRCRTRPPPSSAIRRSTDRRAELVGEIYQDLLPGGASPPMEVPPDSLLGRYTRAFVAEAGLAPGDTISIASGTEGDQFFPGGQYTPAGTEMLLRAVYPIPGAAPRYYNSTFYVAPSGAGVWATGTNKWAAYLDGDREPANPKVQAITRVVLGWMDRH